MSAQVKTAEFEDDQSSKIISNILKGAILHHEYLQVKYSNK